MATVLKLIQGSTTVDLNDSTNTEIVDYTPVAENPDVEGVSESVTILVKSSSVATFLSKRSEIMDMLRRGKDRQKNKSGQDPVYVTFQPDGAASAWRSEQLDYRIINEDNIHAVPLKNLKTKITLAWTRKNWWEANSETAVPLTNGNGSDTTSGLVIYNCNDGTGTPPAKRNNYAEIKAADVSGDLPGATRIEVTNLDGTYNILDMWIGHNYTDPTNAVEIYEAEDATGETGTATAGYSGGEYVSKTLASGSETTLFTWTITAGAMAAAKGQWIHALTKFFPVAGDASTYFRLKLIWNLTTLWQSNQVRPDTSRNMALRDLFQFRLPPGLQGLTSLDALDMVLTGEQSTGSSVTINMDFLALVPADSWRYMVYNGYGCAQNYRIVDDGVNDYLYQDSGSGSNKVPIINGYGEAVRLMPGKLQRLYFFLHSSTGGAAPNSMSMSLKVYYRPRRLTL